MIFTVFFVFGIVGLLGVIPLWGLLGIPILTAIIIFIIAIISNGYIILQEHGIEWKNGSEEAVYIPINKVKRIYRGYKYFTNYASGAPQSVTEITVNFELEDGKVVKINDMIYSSKNRKKLFEYLNRKGLKMDEK